MQYKVTGFSNIGWAFSAITLIHLYTNLKSFPVSHHITMVAGYATEVFDNLLIVILFGIGAILLGLFLEKRLNSNAKTYIDMPGVVIFLGSLLTLPFA